MTEHTRAQRKSHDRGRSGGRGLGKWLLAITLLLIGAFVGVLAYVGLSGGIDFDALLADSEPAAAASSAPKYSFYDDLPRPPTAATATSADATPDSANNAQPAIPPIALISRQPDTESTATTNPDASEPPPAAASDGGEYMVQAGAFARRSDADRRKANLALLGVQAVVERGVVDGGEVYRVRIGPFASAEQARTLRLRLEQDNIQSFTVKRE